MRQLLSAFVVLSALTACSSDSDVPAQLPSGGSAGAPLANAGGVSSGGGDAVGTSGASTAGGAEPTAGQATGGAGQAGAAGATTGGAGAAGGGAGGAAGGGGTAGASGGFELPLPESWVPPSGYTDNKNVPHGMLQVTTYDNAGLGKTGNNGRKANVYTPPGYDKTKKYPVLYALHGIGGDHTEWLSSKPKEILDNLYAAGKLEPMVVVFPNGRAMNPDSSPSDIYGQENTRAFNDFWSKDFRDYLIPHIEKTFAVYADAQHRAVLGYSMGGMQALQFGLGNPTHFSWVGALAPATAGLGHPDVSKLDPSAVNAAYYRLFVAAGDKDSLGLHAPAQKFHQALDARGIDNLWVSIANGNHDGSTWSPGLYDFAQIIFR